MFAFNVAMNEIACKRLCLDILSFNVIIDNYGVTWKGVNYHVNRRIGRLLFRKFSNNSEKIFA